MRTNLVGLLTLAAVAVAADQNSYERGVAEWRALHEAKLKADDGWLTVVGLYWLKDGENRIGSKAGVEVSLPGSMPLRAGAIIVHDGKARFKPAPGVAVTINGKPAPEMDLRTDVEPSYDVLALGRVKFYVIKRDGKLGVRVKNNDSSTRRQFTGLHWYPVDASWRVQAKFIPWAKPHVISFDTLKGVREKDESPGYVVFHRAGKEFRLEPVVDDNQLWFVIRDETSGKATYSASRFLYAELPKGGLKQEGPVELDFNKAENPPCVFTDFATCPLPPPQNRLPVPVAAGEQMYGSQH
jgi:uncharacterized protein (DUF1684 family)